MQRRHGSTQKNRKKRKLKEMEKMRVKRGYGVFKYLLPRYLYLYAVFPLKFNPELELQALLVHVEKS